MGRPARKIECATCGKALSRSKFILEHLEEEGPHSCRKCINDRRLAILETKLANQNISFQVHYKVSPGAFELFVRVGDADTPVPPEFKPL